MNELYHYTSINTLSMILKNKSIKFNRLDFVNDPLDGFSSDFLNSRKLVYVACFTARQDDSLPMWSLYTPNMNGVRIAFPTNLFGEINSHRFGMDIRPCKQKILNQESTFIAGPEKVIYKSTVDEIDHRLVKDLGHAKQFNTFEIGKYKIDDWKFEEEYRFKIFSINYIFGSLVQDGAYDNKLKEMESQIPDKTHEVFVDIDQNIFKNVKILLGPKTTEPERLIVEALAKTYSPEITCIEKSKKMVN